MPVTSVKVSPEARDRRRSPLKRAPVTVIIPAMNEAVNLGACLDTVRWADQVLVVDSHSADRSAEVARQRGAEVHQFRYNGSWPKKKNWALMHLPIAHEWVLLLDADERVTPELASEIEEVLADPGDVDGFFVNRKLIFLGRWIRHCGWYPSWNMRLFRHRCGRFERLSEEATPGTGDVEVHEHVVLDGKVGYLRHDLIHEDFKSISHFIERHNRYSTWEAAIYGSLRSGQNGKQSIRSSLVDSPIARKRWMKRLWVRLPFRPLLRFAWMYIVRLGFLDGRPGFLFCVLMSFHEAMINAKCYELHLSEAGRVRNSWVHRAAS